MNIMPEGQDLFAVGLSYFRTDATNIHKIFETNSSFHVK